MRPALLLAAVCLGWGTIPLVAAEAGVSPPILVFARVWIAAGGLALILASTRAPGPRLLSIRPGRCAVTGAVLAAHWTAMFAAYERAPDAIVIFVIFLAPVGIALIERPALRLVTALVVALGGFALIAGPTVREAAAAADGDRLAGIGLATASGALFVALVLLAKPLAELYGGLRLTLLEMAVAGVFLAPVVALTGDAPGADLVEALPWLLVLGLAHTALGTAVYLHALGRLPATEVGILGYLEPVGVVLFAWLLLGDAPTLTTAAGGLLVVAGGALAVTGGRQPASIDPAHAVPAPGHLEVQHRVPR